MNRTVTSISAPHSHGTPDARPRSGLTSAIAVCATVIAAALAPATAACAVLTDITVFASNSEGNNWNGLIWNTQGQPPDARNVWNLYVSEDPLSDTTPAFINGFNDDRTKIAVPLVPGARTFSIYGEGVDRTFDALQHFVLNLYFEGIQTSPGISGVQTLTNDNLAPAGHPNGLDIFGDSGHAEAGSLSAAIGDQLITLTAFSWITGGQTDIVWPHWANDAPYSGGSSHRDYFGSFTLSVRSVPAPGSAALLGLGAVALAASRRRRR